MLTAGFDILVNKAATNPHFGPLLTAEESHWAKMLDVNVTGYFRTIQACAPLFKQHGGWGVGLCPPWPGAGPNPVWAFTASARRG